MLKKLLSTIIVGFSLAVLFSGCALTTKYRTTISSPVENKQYVSIVADQDATSAGFLMTGSVIRTNYMYAYGIAAQAAVDKGYTHFTITYPEPLVSHLIDRNVQNVQEAYDACTSGKNSFTMSLDARAAFQDQKKCDSIYRHSNDHTFFGGTVVHMPVSIGVKLHNGPISDSATFDANEVLNSSLIKGLDKEYFKKMQR